MAPPPKSSPRDDNAEKIRLFYAVTDRSPDKAIALLDARADANARDYERRCPLHIAAGRGNAVMINLLLERRADLNATDMFGNTPLQQATRCRHRRAAKLLKDKGATLQANAQQAQLSWQQWELDRSDIKIGAELSRTLKSTLHKATWNGNDVVVKCTLAEEPISPTASSSPPTEPVSPTEPMSPTEPGSPKGAARGLDNELLHELNILTSVRHPDLVMFFGCCVLESPVMIVTEFLPNGDLERHYKNKKFEKGSPWVPPRDIINRWGRDILRALRYLHNWRTPIIHRDLKPMNVLLTAEMRAKVADFGVSKSSPFVPVDMHRAVSDEADEDKADEEPMSPLSTPSRWSNMTRGVGSWRYMAPEVARGEEYTEKIDIYSWGLILYFLSSGRQPFHEFQDLENVLNDFTVNREPRPKASECPAPYRAIMEAAWHVDARKRPSAYELVEMMVAVQSTKACLACSLM